MNRCPSLSHTARSCGSLCVRKNTTSLFDEGFPGSCYSNLTMGSGEKLYLQALFEVLDLLAQRGLSDINAQGSTAKM